MDKEIILYIDDAMGNMSAVNKKMEKRIYCVT